MPSADPASTNDAGDCAKWVVMSLRGWMECRLMYAGEPTSSWIHAPGTAAPATVEDVVPRYAPVDEE